MFCHKNLCIKTENSSKSFFYFSCLIFRAQNVLTPRTFMLLNFCERSSAICQAYIQNLIYLGNFGVYCRNFDNILLLLLLYF